MTASILHSVIEADRRRINVQCKPRVSQRSGLAEQGVEFAQRFRAFYCDSVSRVHFSVQLCKEEEEEEEAVGRCSLEKASSSLLFRQAPHLPWHSTVSSFAALLYYS